MISGSLEECEMVLPLAISTSIRGNNDMVRSGLCFMIEMIDFSTHVNFLVSHLVQKIPGQVTLLEEKRFTTHE